MDPSEKVVRWKVWGLVAVAVVAAGLTGLDLMTGAEWSAAIGSVVRGLFGGVP